MRINLYTDGAAKGNPGPGGYGAILETEDKSLRKEFCEGYKLTTNNRMELLAVIVGLEKLKRTSDVTVWSDSKYVVDSVEKGWVFSWEKKGFHNRINSDLWIRFLKVYRMHRVKFIWIKGHAGHPENERADRLAVYASEKEKLKNDFGYKGESEIF